MDDKIICFRVINSKFWESLVAGKVYRCENLSKKG